MDRERKSFHLKRSAACFCGEHGDLNSCKSWALSLSKATRVVLFNQNKWTPRKQINLKVTLQFSSLRAPEIESRTIQPTWRVRSGRCVVAERCNRGYCQTLSRLKVPSLLAPGTVITRRCGRQGSSQAYAQELYGRSKSSASSQRSWWKRTVCAESILPHIRAGLARCFDPLVLS